MQNYYLPDELFRKAPRAPKVRDLTKPTNKKNCQKAVQRLRRNLTRFFMVNQPRTVRHVKTFYPPLTWTLLPGIRRR